MAALLLPTIRRPRRQPSVALPTDHLVTVVFSGEGLERGFDDTASETKDEVERGFLKERKRGCRLAKKNAIEGVKLGNRKRARRNPGGEFGRCKYFLNVIVRECAAVFELFAGKDQALLIGGDAFLVLDLAFDIVDRVRGLDLEGDGLARQGLDEAVKNGTTLGILLF